MSLRDKLIEFSYLKGYNNCIWLIPEDVDIITLEDICALIYFWKYKSTSIKLQKFKNILHIESDGSLFIHKLVHNINEIILLFIIAYGPFNNIIIKHSEIDNEIYVYPNEEQFMKMVDQFGILHIEVTQNIIKTFQMSYLHIAQREVDHYLGKKSIKSARNT